jgi:hypothetical protein
MAAFRKGHMKVVKWMVNHVTQFPSDQEMTRYISTVSDKVWQCCGGNSSIFFILQYIRAQTCLPKIQVHNPHGFGMVAFVENILWGMDTMSVLNGSFPVFIVIAIACICAI